MANKLPLDDAALVYEVCRIDHLTKRKSNELSGGERQRIAFAKALVTSPKLLLLDEPFSNLDAIHRNVLKAVINDVHERLNTTCILVSHDPSDLLSWADEIIILNSGKIIQRGSPEEVYTHPVNEYAAALFGKYNSLSPELIRLFPSLQNDIRRFLRPGDFRISRDSNGVESKVERSSFLGTYYEAELNLSGYSVIVVSDHECKEGETVYLTLK
jgi:ABC-type sulfate/molybdate transport systems ATPase subunit